jgi:hypothetical protein
MNEINENSCCICGTVKNCGKYLLKVFENIKNIGSLFNEYQVVLCVDYSTDDTFKILDDIKKKHSNVIIHINRDKLFKDRTNNLTKARNKYLNIIRNKFMNYDYFIVMDCDNVCEKMTNINILKKHLENSDKWDGLTFNKKPYYDAWALSINPYFINCHWFVDWDKYSKYVTSLLKNCNQDEYISCLSAFNGFAIYKLSYFIHSYYNDNTLENLKCIPKHLIKQNMNLMNNKIKKFNKLDCEHKIFHYNAILKHQAKLMISPNILFY